MPSKEVREDNLRDLLLVDTLIPGDLITLAKVAAEGIETFFQTIIEKANGEWLGQNPQHYLEIAKGDLKIDFYSELVPITWQFIAQYASVMRRALDLGFTSMFDMRLVTPTGIVVFVHLRVKQALAATAA